MSLVPDTRQALLDAIRDRPDDDAPRLIYADWIEEHGDTERAKFIRTQCALARLPYWHPEQQRLAKEATSLFKRNRRRWLVNLPRESKNHFERGFLQDVPLTGRQFQDSIQELWRIEPVATLRLRGSAQEWQTALQNPLVQQLRGLILETTPEVEQRMMVTLTECPHLGELRDLMLWFESPQIYNRNDLGALQRWTLPKLERLTWGYRPTVSDLAMAWTQAALMSSKILQHVRQATLFNHRGIDGAMRFRYAPCDHLQRLFISGNEHQDWWDSLLNSQQLGQLQRLALPSRGVHRETIEQFLAGPLLPQLTTFTLLDCDWPTALLCQFAQSPRLANLRELYWSGIDPVNDDVAEAIATNPALQNLRYLAVSNTGITSVGYERLRNALPEAIISYVPKP